MTKWYRITKPKQKGLLKTDSRNELDLFAYDSASSIYLSSTDRDTGNLAEDVGIRRQLAIVPPGAEVCVRVELEVPSASASLNPSHEQKESSFVLQTLLKGNEKESSTISVLWNLTDNVKYVQNMMSGLLDQIESLKNLLNWTSPSKTFPLYVALVAVWLVTILVPGRLIVLAIGLYEFFFVFMPIPEGRNTMIRFGNLVQSIPNDDDLAQIYGTEKRAYAASKQAEWKHTEKSRKLQLVLDSPWHGLVSIKGSSSSSGHLAGSGEEWVEVFLLLQGRRLVWWVSEEALDQGKMAAGQLLLCGHSGLAQVSPMDIRKFGGDSRLIAVFGQDYVGRPQKLSILLQDSDSKQSLYALLNALSS
uniref:Uncharacterized protein n=1 Tax=Spumella elongata TaxID=89044 RepID=A0A7S3H4W7_9STRA